MNKKHSEQIEDLETKNVEQFLNNIRKLTKQFVSGKTSCNFISDANKMLKHFKSFAVVNKFTSFRILDCYNEVKISLLKWNRFARKEDETSIAFKEILDSIFAVIEDLYFYEIFGFFSTSIHPQEYKSLPVICYFGCTEGWQKEPYLTEDGKAAYKDVIRFDNGSNKELLCMTLEDEPEILEGRERCVLSDDEINSIKKFIYENRETISLHYEEKIDSLEFLERVKG